MMSSLIQVTNSTKYAAAEMMNCLCLMKNKNPTHWDHDSAVLCISHGEFPKYPHLYTDDTWNKVQGTYVRSSNDNSFPIVPRKIDLDLKREIKC